MKYSVQAVSGGFKELVHYDYRVGDYGFKNFTFEDKKLNQLIMNAKGWAHTAQAMKKQYKTIFVYDVEKDEVSSYRIIMNILREHAYRVMPSSEVIDFVIGMQQEVNVRYQQELELE